MAHPDDAEIEIGGTLLHLKDLGWKLGIVTMTSGDCGSSTHSRKEITRIRYEEARSSAEQLGAWYACGGLQDLEVFANAEHVRVLVEIMRTFDPDVIVTHSPVDYMLDHEETSRLARGASFAMSIPLYETQRVPPATSGRSTPALYYSDPMEGVDPFGRRVYPQFYVDVSKQLSKKRELLSCHVSQREWLHAKHGMDAYLEMIDAWAARYGQECGLSYAEGLRQHCGHGYPKQAILQDVLAAYVRVAPRDRLDERVVGL